MAERINKEEGQTTPLTIKKGKHFTTDKEVKCSKTVQYGLFTVWLVHNMEYSMACSNAVWLVN